MPWVVVLKRPPRARVSLGKSENSVSLGGCSHLSVLLSDQKEHLCKVKTGFMA